MVLATGGGAVASSRARVCLCAYVSVVVSWGWCVEGGKCPRGVATRPVAPVCESVNFSEKGLEIVVAFLLTSVFFFVLK